MLLSKAAGLPSVQEIKAAAVRGRNNADVIFKMKDGRRPALIGNFRFQFSELKRSLQPVSARMV